MAVSEHTVSYDSNTYSTCFSFFFFKANVRLELASDHKPTSEKYLKQYLRKISTTQRLLQLKNNKLAASCSRKPPLQQPSRNTPHNRLFELHPHEEIHQMNV